MFRVRTKINEFSNFQRFRSNKTRIVSGKMSSGLVPHAQQSMDAKLSRTTDNVILTRLQEMFGTLCLIIYFHLAN